MPKTKSPVESAQAKVPEGWTVDHAEPAQVASASGVGKSASVTVVIKPAEYRAWRRSPNGDTLVEKTGDSEEHLLAQIEAWEASQHPAEQHS
jgi:hypothetical protein